MAYPTNNVQLLTNTVVAIKNERPRPQLALTAMMGEKIVNSAKVSIETRKHNKLVASDVFEGGMGNRNSSSKSTVDSIVPPFYDEYFDLVSTDGYESIASDSLTPETIMANLANRVIEATSIMEDKINRAAELQWSGILKTGVIKLKNGDDINYNRNALSMITLAGTAKWGAAAAKISDDLKKGCEYVRNVGNAPTMELNAILGDGALTELLNSDEIKNLANSRRMSLIDIKAPEQISAISGLTYHGQLSVGAYRINLYTYSETYVDDAGLSKRFWQDGDVVILPDFTFLKDNMKTVFGGIPSRLPNGAGFSIKGEKIQYSSYIDEQRGAHLFAVKSKPVAVPISVDAIYTITVK